MQFIQKKTTISEKRNLLERLKVLCTYIDIDLRKPHNIESQSHIFLLAPFAEHHLLVYYACCLYGAGKYPLVLLESSNKSAVVNVP